MILRRLLTITILLTSTIWSHAQQINPVPDYVFRNQMSVGRNAVTDTAAYFSIGPRYGATKGFMPPIVGDTATFSSGKRNGLLIFSVQKNKFLYWDSVRVQWSDMAGSSGAYIVAGDTSAMLAPYLRKADTTAMLLPYLRKADTTTLSNRINLKLNISDTSSMLGNYVRHAGYGLTKSGQSFLVDTLNIATRAWRQKGLDSLAALEVSGSGTTNYLPKFTAASTIGNSQIFDNGTNVGINQISPSYRLDISGNLRTTTGSNFATTSGKVGIGNTNTTGAKLEVTDASNFEIAKFNATSTGGYITLSEAGTDRAYIEFGLTVTGNPNGNYLALNNIENGGRIRLATRQSGGTFNNTAFIVTDNGRVLMNTDTDGGFQADVNGTFRSGTMTVNTNGQGRTISTFTGANSSGSNIFIGGGGLSSSGTTLIPDYGSFNTSIGVTSLRDLTEGYSNSAIGMNSLRDLTTGYHNTGMGKDAAIRITTGYENVAVGSLTLGTTTGYKNVAIGFFAGRVDTLDAFASTNNTSVFIGNSSKPAVNGDVNEIVIGYNAKGNGSNTVTIGNSSITQNYFSGALNTSAPSGGSIKPWKLGEAATVSPTSPNRTIRIEIDGTVYYLHAKTTND